MNARQEKTILRQQRRHHFVQIPNETARDPALSWKATGLLCFLLSLPDRWEINLAHLSSVKKDGRDATRAGMKELEDGGYLQKDVLRDDAGRIEGTQWIVSDFPFSGFPKTDSPPSEEPTQRIQTGKKTELKNTTTKEEREELWQMFFDEAREKGKPDPQGWADGAVKRIDAAGLSIGEQQKLARRQAKQRRLGENKPVEFDLAAQPGANQAKEEGALFWQKTVRRAALKNA